MKYPDIISDTRGENNNNSNHFQQNMEKDKKLKQTNSSTNVSLLIPIKNETTISSGSSSSETKIYTNKNVFVLKSNNQIKELHTVLRDKYIQ